MDYTYKYIYNLQRLYVSYVCIETVCMYKIEVK